MSDPRAVRYRRLALAEKDEEVARLLRQLADEADEGKLVTSPLRFQRGAGIAPRSQTDKPPS